MQFSIVKKIALPLILLLLIIISVILFSFYAFIGADEGLNKLRYETKIEGAASRLGGEISTLLFTVNEYIISRDTTYIVKYPIVRERINQNISLLNSLPLDTAEKSRLKDIKIHIDSIDYYWSIIKKYHLGEAISDEAFLVEKLDDTFKGRIYNDLEVFLDHVQKTAEKEYSALHEKKENIFFFFMVISIASILISLAVIYLAVNKISRPILRLIKAAQRIAIRDFSVKLKMESKDEVGMLIIAFNAMITEINKRYEDLENFSHIVAHDLKSPLSGIIGMSDILIADYRDKLDEEGREFLESISASGKQMTALITDLLNFATAGKIEFSDTPVSLNNMLNEITNDLRFLIKRRNVSVIVHENLPQILCDPVKFPQVWRNLITNAIKYNRSDNPEIEIGTRAYDDNSFYCFFVRDNGIGILDEDIEEIFVPFKRAAPSKEFEGTGIGLAIVKRIIEFHNGKIWAESTPEKGTTFFFTIPKLS